MQKKLWPADTFVDFEQGLNNAIKRLRAALDDNPENPHFIETLPRHGYRFIGPVNGSKPASAKEAKTARRAGALIGLFALVLLAVVVGLFYSARRAGPVTSPSEYTQLTNFTDSAVAPSFSPDGRMVTFKRGEDAFFSPGEIYVKLLPNGEPIQLTNDANRKYAPAFALDGSRIAYTDFNVSHGSFAWDTWTVSVLLGGSRSSFCRMPRASRGSAMRKSCSPRSRLVLTWASWPPQKAGGIGERFILRRTRTACRTTPTFRRIIAGCLSSKWTKPTPFINRVGWYHLMAARPAV